MQILVIGSGGREHALVWKLAQSKKVNKIYAIPGNPGIAAYAECVAMDIEDQEALCRFAKQNQIDLTVVGPELPLVQGLTDKFCQHGLLVFGPSQAAAQIEGSKSFAKDLMAKYEIPTAYYKVCTSSADAKDYIRQKGAPIVVKADGLAAGKGVIVAMTEQEACQAVEQIMEDAVFGSAGAKVVIEEYLEGPEASLLAFVDGKHVVPMLAAQDHKRVYDQDQGPNTGGMGAYAPAPVVTAELYDQILHTILQPTVDAMAREGCEYRGCLYAGLMITAQGPKVIEFNARFGDPETQVVLPLLKTDLVDIMVACAKGELDGMNVEWDSCAAVCIVAAAGGYPLAYNKGNAIQGIKAAEATGAVIFQAGTSKLAGQLVTNGGRVLGVTAVGKTIAAAQQAAYRAVNEISFDGMHFRKDIAWRALQK